VGDCETKWRLSIEGESLKIGERHGAKEDCPPQLQI